MKDCAYSRETKTREKKYATMVQVSTHGRCLGPEGNAAAPPDPDVAPPPPLNSVNDIFCPLAMVDKYYGAIRDTKAKYESLSGIGDNQLLSVALDDDRRWNLMRRMDGPTVNAEP